MIKELLYIMNKKELRQMPVLFIEIILGALLETIGISAILPVISILIEPEVIHENGFVAKLYQSGDFKSISTFMNSLLFGLAIFYVIKNIYLFIMHYHQFAFINRGQRMLTKRMMINYFSQPYIYFTNKNPADLQRNVASDVGRCYQTILSMITVLTQSCVAVALGLYLLITDWLTTVLILGIIGITLFLFIKITHNLSYKYGKITRMYGASVIQWINQSLGGIKEVKLLNREKYFINKIDDSYAYSTKAECKVNVISITPSLIMETTCIAAIMISTMVEIAVNDDLKGYISVLTAFALAAIRLIPTIGSISSRLNMITFNKSSIHGIYSELVQLEKGNREKDYQIEALTIKGIDRVQFNSHIMVKNLCFCYPGSDTEVLHDISLCIKRGESIAFVGTSGAGKTTLADLIIGVLEPSHGTIMVDGINISKNIEGWYKQIGYIPQNIYLMDDSIRNNIAFGINEGQIDEKKIWEALKKAQLEDFVRGLPEGLETNLGDRGIRCSGGQRQRLGIARALYDDPEFLILDEATSALDNETERAIMEAIDGLKGKKTLLIIAHRLSTIQNCDVIYRIENGTIMKESSISGTKP